MAHENWMSQLPEHLKAVPLTQLAIPGTHDSGTFDIDMSSGAAPDLAQYLKKLKKYTCCVGQKFIVDWALTQSIDFTAQLVGGIRYFDLRLGYDSKSQDLWLVHGLLSCTLRSALKEFSNFLASHPSEVVFLDFNHFYAMNANQHLRASNMILEYLEDYLYPQPSLYSEFPSINDCMDKKTPVILFYWHWVEDMPFWSSHFISSPWGNTSDVKSLIAFLDANYVKPRSSKILYVTQGVLTPDTAYVATHPLSSIRGMADDINPAFIKWLRTKKAGELGVNVCITDFFQDFEIVPTILALNK